ncbi:MAG: LON peptidase substrate-binding domain-containing protein [Phycisphaerae bacterium]|jgi:Lon protease-like protein|nr:LON peptidase substrate-binding domain-containing protein [Phycisphaerae bacterium]MBT5365736.1 LON peptidase substrate-binding domain-containing protein [Phycisphaerae bacterium]MBT6269855.1 LON peptidase substrate-binding domain-containing protein [Phycisphaerae bacterium]MBT6283209.1 LON peptidase substrate-binding domain-containing protein [Phycisphaerae bacterium]
MSEQVSVQFKQEFPVFTLPETMLLPHTVMPITVTEPRYCQLTNQALDQSGQIALASVVDKGINEACSDLRKVVCLGQIVQHEKIKNGYNILVYGLCRAEITHEIPAKAECLYRTVKLKPIESKEEQSQDLEIYRVDLLHYMFRPNMERLENHDLITSWISGQELTTSALFELIACTIFNDSEFKYTLLAEPSSEARCLLVLKELQKLDTSISLINKQSQNRWKKGISLN